MAMLKLKYIRFLNNTYLLLDKVSNSLMNISTQNTRLILRSNTMWRVKRELKIVREVIVDQLKKKLQ